MLSALWDYHVHHLEKYISLSTAFYSTDEKAPAPKRLNNNPVVQGQSVAVKPVPERLAETNEARLKNAKSTRLFCCIGLWKLQSAGLSPFFIYPSPLTFKFTFLTRYLLCNPLPQTGNHKDFDKWNNWCIFLFVRGWSALQRPLRKGVRLLRTAYFDIHQYLIHWQLFNTKETHPLPK